MPIVIKDLEESGLVKAVILATDAVLLALSHYLAFALVYNFAIANTFPYPMRVELIVAIVCFFPCHYSYPPVFVKRMAHGNDILMRSLYVIVQQTLLMLAAMALISIDDIPLRAMLAGSAIFFLLLYGERMAAHRFLNRLYKQGRGQRNVVLVGHPWNLEGVYHTLKEHSLGFKIMGIFTRQEMPNDMQLSNLGDRKMVMGYLRQHPEVSDLYIVPDTDYVTETEEIFRYCEDHMIRFYALPVFMEFLTKRMELSHLGSTMLLSVRNEPLQDPVKRIIKRTFDILVSGLFLCTVFPFVYLVAGLIIKKQSPGSILFRQKRNGLNGEEFYCLKFRSMHVNADSDRLQATKDDPRKFKFGDFMRKTNIDELPQFINVFLGSMSLVGPRPHMLLHTEEYSQLIRKYMIRHLVKPGITGWAQVHGFRGETKTLKQMEDRVKADIWYVENWSFALDLRIMWRTLTNMIKHNEENAY